jgi:hypothetical protein
LRSSELTERPISKVEGHLWPVTTTEPSLRLYCSNQV